MEAVSRRSLNSRLFRWHQARRRPLLIREAADPWQVLVAEVMSQQTGIERVGPAWRRFVDRWPTPVDLAGAGTHELLAAWSGLGYNRRALALRECARKIVADHGGRVPADGRRTGCPARDRAVHGASGRGVGLRGPGRAARRQRPARRLAAARRAVIVRRGSRLPRTIWCRAVSPVAGSMPSWISPRERVPPERRCAMHARWRPCVPRAGWWLPSSRKAPRSRSR